MENKLKDILNDVTHWLNFAEAKNLALLTFDGVWLGNCIKRFYDTNKIIYVAFAIPLIFAMIICLSSFIPQIHGAKWISKKLKKDLGDKEDTDNLLFYKDIYKYSAEDYYKEIQKIHLISNDQVIDKFDSDKNKYEKAMINQIVILSGIAYKKHFLFDIAAKITICLSAVLVLSLIIA